MIKLYNTITKKTTKIYFTHTFARYFALHGRKGRDEKSRGVSRGGRWGRPPTLKYRLIYICSQRNSGNRTSEDALTFFLGVHLILGGKLNVGRRVDLFFGLHRYFQ